ncbi:MAG: hypothetical protein CMH48_01255 [Muricauda sp.]|nr:hypothetical protein [Allomuricauda sp.]MBC29450.1 hypothetical protein [Allomuricauda sp.]|tara:strand:+ start:838 stop:2637 length:1800 start_codon:yes stop_codon:yes gene_type:complete
MKRIVFIILFVGFQVANAQYKISDGTELLNLQKVPMEKMYVHASSPLLFSGEYLYYKLYCINAQTNKLSSISRMAYVSLVNDKGEPVFEHKIRLEKGMGQSDHFINTDVPSGNYKLVAYTQWMKNGGLAQVFKDDIAIVNPYLADQSAILRQNAQDKEISVKSNDRKDPDLKQEERNDLLQLQLDTLTFVTRQKVMLTLRNYKGNLGHGQYSIAVKKREQLAVRPRMDAETFTDRYLSVNKRIPQTIGDSIFLPEQRGELIFGRVIDDVNNLPAVGKEVIISVPGQEFLLKLATTDQNGYFFTYLRKEYKTPLTIFQVLDQGEYSIDIGRQEDLPFDSMKFGNFTIDPSDAAAIKERSIQNQIENAYFEVKPDSILQPDSIDPFDGGVPEVFNLDEYTRFPTLQETLIEILNTVGYRTGKDGHDYIRVAQDFEKFNEPYNDYPAIVLIDGVFIPDHGSIKDFKAEQVKTIKVLRDQLILGAKQYQGIVSIETLNGDYYYGFQRNNSIVSDLELPKTEKNYFRQSYSQESDINRRIPDYRRLLLWEPQVDLSGTEANFEFYTSDITGDFDIYLEGFTTYGKPISMKKSFVVTKSKTPINN